MTTQQKIISALGLNEEQYSMLVFDTGIEYLQANVPANWLQDIAETKTFWSWWKHQWAIIDNTYYAAHKVLFGCCSVDMLYDIYLTDHRSYMSKVQVEERVWQEFKHIMLHQATKELTNAA